MKYWFLLLALVNLSFYLWETGVSREPARAEKSQTLARAGIERIMLVGELTQPPVVSPEAPPPMEHQAMTAVRDETAPGCYRLGPFATAGLARRLSPSLGPGFINRKIVKRAVESANGYWILYPPASDVESANANRKLLADRGFPDAWVMEKGENRLAVAVGLVNQEKFALEAINRYRAMGMDLVVKPRLTSIDQWWIEVRGDSERKFLNAVAEERKLTLEAVEVKDCSRY